MKKLLLETSFSKIYMIVMIIITLLILGGYFSYAMFTVSKEKGNAISIVTGNLEYKLRVDEEETNKLTVESNSSKEFIITLSNPNNIKARFNFYYIGDIPTNVEAGYILDCETNNLPEAKGVILEKINTTGSSNTYKIMVENESNQNVTIELGVNVGLDYNDLSLPDNGHLFNEYVDIPNAPILDDNMIAVSYDGTNWIKVSNDNSDNNWYNYEELKWANAVTVSEGTRDTYLSSEVGTPISMDDIETMWVWIPRYSYTIGSTDGTNYYGKQGCYLESTPTQALPGEIDIRFIDTNIKDRGNAKYVTTTGSREYYTPDAFTFGDEELSGIWVGKFETSSSDPSANYGGGNTTELDPMIKPNIVSWCQISISNAFNVSLKMNDEGNRYGFTNKVDTHMMKNSEWAIVAYLSQSKYGKLGNIYFSGSNKEIYANISSEHKTGCSSGAPSNNSTDYGCQYTYDVDINGTGASTTGNIYGIYDMSGGAWEYVMTNYNDVIGNSGFTTMPKSKYYDKYTSNDINTACSGDECISHALSETESWYNDGNNLMDNDTIWMLRGGTPSYYEKIGIFSFGRTIYGLGGPALNDSFRLVIATNN